MALEKTSNVRIRYLIKSLKSRRRTLKEIRKYRAVINLDKD
jgi:hypothetical protein